MAAISYNPGINNPQAQNYNKHGAVVEEIQGLIRVYKDGRIDRPPLIPSVLCSAPSELGGIVTKDVMIDKFLWARFYVPNRPLKLPLIVYFHGGGFCVGSASWKCYHEFLANLAYEAGCVIMSVNYRLAPENRLPAAYEDGVNAIMWLKQQAVNSSNDQKWWSSQCNFSSLFLAGDSAGANIAYQVATQLASKSNLGKISLKGIIVIQPFFGGEARTESEKHIIQPPNSALSLSASDTYWRLSLPVGSNRDHPWCNPLAKGAPKLSGLKLPPTMVCIADMDILKDRNLDFCGAMISAGKQVEKVIYRGVGHAFQVLHNYPLSQTRTREMMSHIKAFMNQ